MLSARGVAVYDDVSTRVTQFRTRVADGISAEEYGTTLATLERMARNLGWSPGREPPATLQRRPAGMRAVVGRLP